MICLKEANLGPLTSGTPSKKLDRFWTGFGLVLTGFDRFWTGFGQVQKKHSFGQVLDRFWTGFGRVLIKSPKPVQKIGQVLTGSHLSGGLNLCVTPVSQ